MGKASTSERSAKIKQAGKGRREERGHSPALLQLIQLPSCSDKEILKSSAVLDPHSSQSTASILIRNKSHAYLFLEQNPGTPTFPLTSSHVKTSLFGLTSYHSPFPFKCVFTLSNSDPQLNLFLACPHQMIQAPSRALSNVLP